MIKLGLFFLTSKADCIVIVFFFNQQKFGHYNQYDRNVISEMHYCFKTH